MKLKINIRSIKGKNHNQGNQNNQDSFYCAQMGNMCCLCVGDGAGSRKHSDIGVRWLVKDLCNFLLENYEQIFNMEKNEISKLIFSKIRKSIEKTSLKNDVKINDLSSTLMFVLTDCKKYIIGHLGDGVIIGEREYRRNVLSFPANGSDIHSTYLTTMPNADRYIRISKNICEDLNGIWLMTDGAMYEVFGDNFAVKGNMSLEDAVKTLSEENVYDDATYAFISWKED